MAACVAPSSAPDETAMVPTYYGDVAALVSKACGGCHEDGGVAPFALETYDQVAERADAIAKVTRERRMPPWPAESGGDCNTFVGQRWLADEEIELLASWARAGAPAGDPASAGPPIEPVATPFSKSVTLGSDRPYEVRASTVDEYRCFVVDPGLEVDWYITAIGVELDRAELVHHIQLFAADDAGDEHALDELAAADAAPGYACGEDGLGADLRYVGVWAPGDLVRRWADGTGILLRAQRRLVLQLHYHNHSGETQLDQTRIGLELAASVHEVGDVYHARNTALYLLPGRSNIDAIGMHSIATGGPATARGVRLHMHALGTRGRLELVRGEQSTCLLSIPRWDFNWQLFYMFESPIALLPGDQLRLTCSYDTTSRSEPVTWGVSTDDEMCIGYTYLTR